MSDPLITIGISPSAEQGVAIAAYSGRYSRMWAWDASSLQILGYQDIKARVVLRDVTDSGSYCAYYAEAHHKEEHYVAISRPPYFRALWLRNNYHLGYKAVLFQDDDVVRHCLTPKGDESYSGRIPEERLLKDSPFRFVPMKPEGHQDEYELFASRCSGIIEYTDRWHWETPAFPHWVGIDPLGRRISVRESQILADEVTFLDCRRQPFEAVSTPDWATNWEAFE